MNDVRSLFSSPELYIAYLHLESGQAIGMRMSRDTYSQSAFLDQRAVLLDDEKLAIPIDTLQAAYRTQNPESRPIGIIAHTAFCGSTLLSRCLDFPGYCMPYKEPYLLHQLSLARRLNPKQEKTAMRVPWLELALALLGRTYSSAEQPVIKLTCSSYNLCSDILQANTGSKLLLQYNQLSQSLVSMLKNEQRRAFSREMAIRAKIDLNALGKFESIDINNLSDSRCAAFVWLGHMYPYLNLLSEMPDRVCSLNASSFFNEPAKSLLALCRFFSLDITEAQIELKLATDVLNKDSKDANRSRDFDAKNYSAEIQQTTSQLQDEIRDAIDWAADLTKSEPIPDVLPSPLMSL